MIDISRLLTNLPGIVYRCRNDKTYTIEFISERCTNILGCAPSDLVANKKTSYRELIHPDDRKRVWNAKQKCLEERRVFNIEYRVIEFLILRFGFTLSTLSFSLTAYSL